MLVAESFFYRSEVCYSVHSSYGGVIPVPVEQERPYPERSRAVEVVTEIIPDMDHLA